MHRLADSKRVGGEKGKERGGDNIRACTRAEQRGLGFL